ncbi:winged helix-turn-helix domain-containing protein [Pseudomonas aeruginosa]|uniref:winged helix-turn-helix domain-containing protein n=1 Tax=Pseudomonas aeruginosa TaxID=287 RepID=UPI001AA033A4|nr:winged helix-turn-helix domain-containing protein [Pseudomonas aeruginosa]
MRNTRLKHKISAPGQGELFSVEQIANIYRSKPDAPLTNAALYDIISTQLGVSSDAMNSTAPVGASGQRHSLVRRAVRFTQQSLKHMGLIERVSGERGVWRLTQAAKRELNAAKPGVKLLGFRTDLGLAIWGSSSDIFKRLTVPISLCFSSPP